MKYYLTKIYIDFVFLVSLMNNMSIDEIDEEEFADFDDEGEVRDFTDCALSLLKDDIEYYYTCYGDLELHILTNYDLIHSKNFLKEFTNDYVNIKDIKYKVKESDNYNELKKLLIKDAKNDYSDYCFYASKGLLK